MRSALSSSTRPGPRSTWRRFADADRAAAGSSARCHSQRWKTTTFIAALRHDANAAPCLFDGPVNGAVFLAWVQKSLVPALRPGKIVIMDNLGSHRGKAVRHAIRQAGAKLFFLPKYSPDLNPIEQVFSKLKHGLRKAAARSYDAVLAAIGELLGSYTPKECAN